MLNRKLTLPFGLCEGPRATTACRALCGDSSRLACWICATSGQPVETVLQNNVCRGPHVILTDPQKSSKFRMIKCNVKVLMESVWTSFSDDKLTRVFLPQPANRAISLR